MIQECGETLTEGGTCGRPKGHCGWSIDAGWPRETVSCYAHAATLMSYDRDVAPYLMCGDAVRSARPASPGETE